MVRAFVSLCPTIITTLDSVLHMSRIRYPLLLTTTTFSIFRLDRVHVVFFTYAAAGKSERERERDNCRVCVLVVLTHSRTHAEIDTQGRKGQKKLHI